MLKSQDVSLVIVLQADGANEDDFKEARQKLEERIPLLMIMSGNIQVKIADAAVASYSAPQLVGQPTQTHDDSIL